MNDLYPYTNTIELAGIPVELRVRNPEANELFSSYPTSDSEPVAVLSVSETDWYYLEKNGLDRSGQIEASAMTERVSDILLAFDRVIIHAVAFSFRGRAWLIAAAPRVGKSTQIKYLMDLYPGEFSVICGDRPILQRLGNGSFLVHPSPWNGKENWKGAPAAPLAGILCLQREEKTSIRVQRNRDAVIPVFKALISSRDTEERIRMLSVIETALLQAVPVYEYNNGGVPDSTHILYKFLTEGAMTDDV